MTVKEIVRDYLDRNGYDGLVNTEIPCGCDKEDLALCDGLDLEFCLPAYKRMRKCSECKTPCEGYSDTEEPTPCYGTVKEPEAADGQD